MSEYKYRISLCIKRTEDRFLGVKEAPSYGTRALGGNMLYHWLPEGESFPLDLTKEEAYGLVEKILAAKVTNDVHDLDVWSILKLQACTNNIEHNPDHGKDNYTLGCVFHEHLHPVYIGLYRTKDDYHETQWGLQLNESQVREY